MGTPARSAQMPSCSAAAARKVSAALVEEAVDSLAQAKAMHDDLEAVYNPYVDFERVNAVADRLAGEILGG